MPHSSYESTIKKKILYYIEAIRKEPIFDKLTELEHNQKLSHDELEALQLAKLKKIIYFVYEFSPFYHAHFNKAGVDPGAISGLNDLAEFPKLTKDHIRQNLVSIPTQSGIKIFPVKTSGSTGEPLKFFKDRIASAYTYASMYRGLRWHGVDICSKEAYLWGIPINRKEKLIADIKDFLLNRFREKAFDLSDAVNYAFYTRMKKSKPALLSGYSSLLYEFARYIKANSLSTDDIRPKIIKFTAEMMYGFQRELLEKVFGCSVIGEYGSAETGVVAFQCPQQSYHVLTDCCCLELSALPSTSYYEIIVTNLNSYGFPLIRYQTGDLVQTDTISTCGCGLPFPVIPEIIGRSADIVETPEGRRVHCNIFSYIIKYLLSKGFAINKILFVQTNISTLLIYTPPSLLDDSFFKTEVVSLIHQRISPSLKIDFILYSRQAKKEPSKLRYFISEIDKTKEGLA